MDSFGFATLFAVLAIFSMWANRQALNTDSWVSTSKPVGVLVFAFLFTITPFR